MTSAANEPAIAEAIALGAGALAEIVSGTQAGITVTDSDRRYIYANTAACRMLGRSLADLRGRDLLDSFPEREHATMLAHLPHDLDEDGALFTCMMLGADGTERAIVCSAYTVDVAGAPHRVSILRDLSAARSAARAATALAQVTAQDGEAIGTDEILARLARHAVQQTRGLTARILVVDDGRLVAGGGFGPAGIDHGESSSAWRAIRAGLSGPDLVAEMTLGTIVIGDAPSEPLVLSDARSVWKANPVMQPYAARFKDLEWDAIVCIPLAWENRVFGVLGVSLPSSISGPSEEELAFYSALADQAAVAVTSARLRSQTTQIAAALERSRLARDLHDSVSQALFSMTMHARAAELSMVKAGMDDGGPLSRSVSALSALTRGALAEMRALIFELRPEALAEEGLIAALRKQAAALTAREALSVTVESPESRIAVPPVLEEHLFRIVSEALNNVIKHASAECATVHIALERGQLDIAVSDNGVGFDTAHDRSGHMGLSTMAERARAIGAELTVKSTPGDGTTVSVSVQLSGLDHGTVSSE